MTATEKTEEQIEAERRAAWAAEHPDRCAHCGGTGMAWDYISRLHDFVVDKCVVCNGTGNA